jgi:hypothetical protein
MSEFSKIQVCAAISADADRSFSAYKPVLAEKRHKYEPRNTAKIIVTYCAPYY